MLLEREEELVALRNACRDAAAGAGTVVSVRGAAGIGKTALLLSAQRCATVAGLVVLSATGSELEQELAFGVVRQLFEPAVRGLADDERDRLMSGAASLAGGVLSEPDLTPPRPEAVHAALYGLYWLAVELSVRAPLLICVDDAQWTDTPSLRWLAYLGRRLDGVALSLVLGHRDGGPGALLEQVTTEARARVLRPRPLSAEAVEQWLTGAYGHTPAREFTLGCRDATGGNPLLLGELVAELQAEGVGPQAAAARRIAGVAPEAVARLVLARVARNGADATAVAEAVAVLSADARLDRVAALAGLPLARVAQVADELMRSDVLAAGEPLRFAHPVLRTAVYEQQGAVRRGLGHARAARLLLSDGTGNEHAGAHLLLAPPAGQTWAVEALRAGARAALARGAPDAAVPLLRRALAEGAQDRIDLLLDLIDVETMAQDPAAAEHAREVIAEGETATQRVRGAIAGAQVLLDQGRGSEAVELLETAEHDADAVAPDLRQELAARTLLTASFTGFTGLEQRLVAAGVQNMEGSTAGERLLVALRAIDMALRARPRGDSVRLARRVLAHEDLAKPAHAFLPVLTRVLVLADELDEARTALTRILGGARRRGAVIDLATAYAARSDVELRAGRLDAADADARQALELSREHHLWLLPAALGWAVEVMLERESAEAGLELIEEVGLDLIDPPPTQGSALLLHARGRTYTAAGDPQAAADDFRAAGRIATAWGDLNPASVPWRSSLALVVDDPALAAEELQLAQRFGAARAIGVALRARALLAGGETTIDDLGLAIAALAASPARLEHARAIVDLGAAQRRRGRRGEARETLRAGLDAARACAAHQLAERAREELLAAGARPRRERLHGPDALTASERRVTELAAGGLTNRQIAQALFVTTKTVEMHLSHAYGKLGIKGRDQLRT